MFVIPENLLYKHIPKTTSIAGLLLLYLVITNISLHPSSLYRGLSVLGEHHNLRNLNS